MLSETNTIAGSRILLAIGVLLIFVLSGCQSNPFGVPGGVPGGTPLPSIPSGGGSAGTPGSDSPSPMPPGSSGSDSESGSEPSPEAGGQESGSENSAETSPSWEEEGEGSGGSDEEITFEESEQDEVTFEEPEFEDNGGLTEEELEELEKELNESLGDFDEEIQREKTFAEERANENTDDGPLGGVGVFETYEDKSARNSQSSQSAANSANSSTESSADSDSEGSAANNAGTVTGNQSTNSQGIGEEIEEQKSVSVDLPDEADSDDIVARQIREAAESETDPELKEKLWVEYRKYKNQ